MNKETITRLVPSPEIIEAITKNAVSLEDTQFLFEIDHPLIDKLKTTIKTLSHFKKPAIQPKSTLKKVDRPIIQD